MDPDIHFGDFEQASPTTHVRPDRNGQLAAVGVHTLAPDDLPIFVDMDAMREMVTHAHSDRQVELGGVLLGGQYQDDEGRSFVVVSDCLRARHYESTKGSFKFTHDTWEQITRERERLPPGLEMVGWYHTHPGWGVFLSGLDLFICDNFFNKPLDVALVIDPCRGDTGVFQWTGNPRERIRRTGGYFLFSSRFRRDELHQLANDLESQIMPESVRSSVPPITVQLPPPWAIPSIYGLAMLGMFGAQFCLVLLLTIRLLLPFTGDGSEVGQSGETELAELDRLRKREAEIDAKLEVLDLVVRQQGNVPEGVLTKLVARTSEAEQLRESLRAQQSLARELDAKIARLESTLTDVRRSDESHREEATRLRDQLSEVESKLRSLPDQPSGSLEKSSPDSPSDKDTLWSMWGADWRSYGLGAAFGAGLVGLVWFVGKRSRRTALSQQPPGERGS